MALDFVALDLALFLDTHPGDRDALAKYNDTVAQANDLRKEYEDVFGPLYSFRSMSGRPWQWIDDPWPWQFSFNFEAPREER
jgi:spore coat protein JB